MIRRAPAKQANGIINGVRQPHRCASKSDPLQSLVDLFGVVGEILHQPQPVVERHDRRFAEFAQHHVGKQDRRLFHIGQYLFDSGTRLDADDHRDRQKAYLEALDRLLFAVVEDLEVELLERRDVLALGAAHGHRNGHYVHG